MVKYFRGDGREGSVLNVDPNTSQRKLGWNTNFGVDSSSSSWSKVVSCTRSSSEPGARGGLSLQHNRCPRTARRLGNMDTSSSRALIAKKGSSFTINVSPILQTVADLSKYKECRRLVINECVANVLADASNVDSEVNRFNNISN